MIYVQGNDVKVGNGTSLQLIHEATNAVYGVFLTLKQDMPEDITDEDLMQYILSRIGATLAHTHGFIEKSDPAEVPDDPEDFMNKVFGDLLNGGKDD